MSGNFSPMGAGVKVAATGSSVAGALTMPTGANTIHIANTSATLYVTVAVATSGASATLGASVTLPPMGQIILAAAPTVASVAAIGSAAGPTDVVFTPGRCG